MKVCFETFGCRLNKAEALQMEADYAAKGWERTEKHSDADLFVVSGCSVTKRAQHDCEKLVAHLKRRYPLIPVRVCGCLETKKKSSRSRPAEAKIPQPDAPGGTARFPDVQAPLPTRTARAYLKVQDGCSGKCTFCTVPKFRGASASMPFVDVVDRAKRFIDAGYREIVVTGCNLVLYASEGKRLPDLVAALSALTPAGSQTRTRIRLGSIEPGECALECVHAMAGSANACRFLHIPFQSGANRILIAMKRPYFARDISSLAQTAQNLMPGIRLGCDVMTGFPDETELDFAATKGLVQRHSFSNVHVFSYSERPETPAATYGGAIPLGIRSERAHDLADKGDDNRYAYARQFYGKVVEIVSEGDDECYGRTDEYLWCRAIGHVPRKSLARVLVNRIHHDGTLEGTIRG